MRSILADVRFAVRALGRSPVFALTVVAILALGTGANTAVFAAIRVLFLAPLPYPDADRLLFVWGHRDGGPLPELPVSLPVALAIAERTESFEAVGAWSSLPDTRFSLSGGGEPEDVQYAVVSAELLPLLGARPAAGRLLEARDDSLDAPRVVMISEALWRRRFGASREVLGRSIMLDGLPYAVVGVLPSELRFVDFPRQPDVWVPLGSDPFRDRRFAPVSSMGVVARLRPGVGVDAAQAELATLARAIGREFPPLREWTLLARPFRDQLAAGRRQLLGVLAGAVGLVMLIACANVAGLLLARTAARRRELAVRRALGASRARLMRQLLTECLTLSMAGGAAGLLVASWSVPLVQPLAAGSASAFVPWRVQAEDLGLDGATVAFTLAISIGGALLFGIGPALHAVRATSGGAFGDPPAGAPPAQQRARSLLVAAETALSIVLLVGAGLLARSFDRLASVAPGFVAQGALAVDLALPAEPYGDPSRLRTFHAALLDRLEALPGVASAGATGQLPLTGPPPTTDLRIDLAAVEAGREPRAEYSAVSAGWLQAAGVRLVRGRALTPGDDETAPRVALVNEAFVRTYFPGLDPLGHRVALSNEALRFVAPDAPPVLDFPSAERTIVGVVADVRQRALDQSAGPAVYLPLPQRPVRQLTVVLRASGDLEALAAAVRRAVHDLDAAQPVASIRSLEEVVELATGESRTRAGLVGALSVVALVLASLGVYGLVAYTVALRRREMGIRLALGASGSNLVSLVARQGLWPVAIGAGLGLPGAAAAAWLLRGLLFEVPPLDVVTYCGVALLLVATALAASWLPARRAGRADPIQALRAE